VNTTSLFLAAIIFGLVVFINRGRISRYLARKSGDFDAYRVFLSEGRYIYLEAFGDADRARLKKELRDYRTSGLPFTAGGAIVDFRLITPEEYQVVDLLGGDWKPGDIEKSTGIRLG